MQKFLFDKEIVNNQLSVLNNTLASQRQTKKTLLSYLEKFSDAMYENFNSDNTDSLLSLINEAHSIFECIKSNISKTIELKKFLENIYNSVFLNTIDSEKFNNDFNNLLENISKTNSNYLNFMNNYENFIKPPFINEVTSIMKDTDTEHIQETIQEELVSNETTIEKNITEDIINKEPIIENTIIDKTIITEPTAVETTIKLEESDEESLFDKINPTDIEETSTESIVEKEIIQESVAQSVAKEIINDLTVNITTTIEENKEQEKNIKKDFTIIEDSENEQTEEFIPTIDLQEKVLLIKKDLGIAVLPYSISDLDELFLDDPEKYSSIQDIIDKEYTVNLKDFENSSITRYKEAFKLAKEKSDYTFSQAVNFAKKLLVENEVTALIIASCKNVEELEQYIECLNSNKLKEFHHFKIIEE